MAEEVVNKTLYHVTVTNSYKKAFAANQRVDIGSTYNPFFQFYETVRQYQVDYNGSPTMVRAVEWLKRVRDGNILVSQQILATIAHEIVDHYVMLCREILMEEIRVNEFGGTPPSRQRCIYGAETLEDAKSWQSLVGNGAICELICTGVTHRADSRLLLRDSEPLSSTKERGRAYWRGEMSDNPRPEILFVGHAVVHTVGL